MDKKINLACAAHISFSKRFRFSLDSFYLISARCSSRNHRISIDQQAGMQASCWNRYIMQY